jgi:outer membrane protein
MNIRNILIIIFAVPLIIRPAVADSAEVLSLGEAIRLSLEYNNQYKIVREKVRESRLKIRESWGRLWPDISTDASMTRFGADKGIMAFSYGQYEVNFVKCSLSINPGVFYNSLRESQDRQIMSVEDERRIKLDTSVTAIRLFYKILLTGELIKMRMDSIKALEENLRVVTVGYKTGTYTRLDFLRAKVSVANEKTRLINAQNENLSANAELNIHMGRDIDSPLDLDRRTLARATTEEEFITKWSDEERKGRLTSMIADALKNRPELIQIKYKKKAETHNALAQESLYLWPTIFANGNYGMTRVIEKKVNMYTPDMSANYALYDIGKILEPSGWNKGWTFTIGAVYRWGGLAPFDPAHARADQARSKSRQTDYELDDFIRNVRLDIQQGMLKLISASSAILSQKDNIASAEESLRVAALEFKNGMIDNTKFLDANVELSNAKTLYIQALYDLQTSKAELNRSVGYNYFNF